MADLIFMGLRIGLRASAFRFSLFASVLLIVAAVLASSFSGRQPLTVGLDVGLSGLRFVLLLMVLIWSHELLGRDIERKNLYFSLAYPISRTQFLWARFASLALLALLATMIIGLLLALALGWLAGDYQQQTPSGMGFELFVVLLGIWLDALVVAGFALLLCTLSTTPFLPLLLGLAFALAARGLGPTFDYLRQQAGADPDHIRWFSPVLECSYLWLPDLSRLDWRGLALYQLPWEQLEIAQSVLMAVCYLVALLALASLIFERRDLV